MFRSSPLLPLAENKSPETQYAGGVGDDGVAFGDACEPSLVGQGGDCHRRCRRRITTRQIPARRKHNSHQSMLEEAIETIVLEFVESAFAISEGDSSIASA